MPFSSEELPELKRQSSTRTIVVDSLFSLCFGGPTFAERSGVEGTRKVRKSLCNGRRRPRIFPGVVVLPFGRSTHNLVWLHLLSMNTYTTLLSHFYSRAHYTSFPLTEPIFPRNEFQSSRIGQVQSCFRIRSQCGSMSQ